MSEPLNVLLEADSLVHGPRQADYGHPYDDYTKVGLIWTAILKDKLKPGEEVSAKEAALCMVGIKLSREVNRPKDDNLIDGAGYFEVANMIEQRVKELASEKEEVEKVFRAGTRH